MKSRIQSSVLNATSSVVFQIVQLLLRFVIQNIFIMTLGKSVAGANGLFSNLLTFLSFTDLGIGSAIIFALYKPISENNYNVISSLMNMFKKLYIFIGILITFLGIVLSFFLPFFVKSGTEIPHMQMLFILFVLNTSIGYLFSYKQSLLIAYQLSYVVILNNLLFFVIQTVLQIIVLKFLGSYIGFLIIQIIITILFNAIITIIADSKFKEIKINKSKKIPEKILIDLKKNILGTIASKIGFIFVFSTDNILISKFLGLSIVGIYSNYALLINGINSVINQGATALVATFGNLGVSSDEQRSVDVFYKFQYLIFSLIFFTSINTLVLIQKFIVLWLGISYTLPNVTVFVIVINFAINLLRLPTLTFINAYGLYYPIRYKSLIEASVNFFVGLALIKFTTLGVNAVLIGTIVSNITVNLWWEPKVLFQHGLRSPLIKYHIRTLMFTFVMIITCGLIYFCGLMNVDSSISIFKFIILLVITSIVSILIFMIINLRSIEQKYYLNFLKSAFKN
ncbi:lipopolysaccharide biosynthesis protein [Periweissella ghanensis]|uniref:Uncharacterized protein n=1 Tax=Periweissella ghanensis TaxID=467997 RepID=A0ABM8ZCT1_9LACO|nr:lipopolysaccharide biosynthesis protein [Periweissella ghanensis]MCM0600254.1 lipopolysaccharide biosynthesis protein [Periweissella ghanensis]CAH0419114.1 hypothetical protein WGH24286_01561 [Periweissella ghanensis]